MPPAERRFIHAADLFLDRQLQHLGPLPAELRQTAEDATLLAYQNVVAACLENDADFLLLTGNAFDESEASLRARAALLHGFEALAEAEIAVFVVPGTTDPPEAWRAIGQLPENVTLLAEPGDEPVAVLREGRVAAQIHCLVADATPATPADEMEQHAGPLTIGVLMNPAMFPPPQGSTNLDEPAPRFSRIDYLAAADRRIAERMSALSIPVHHPGGTQGLCHTDTGPHGCHLVEIDESNQIHTRFISTEALRQLRFEIEINLETKREQLLEQMFDRFVEAQPDSFPSTVITTWQIRGAGPLWDALHSDEFQQDFGRSLHEVAEIEENVCCLHQFQLISTSDETAAGEGIEHDFEELLHLRRDDAVEDPADLIPAALATHPDWADRLTALVQKCNPEAVLRRAGELGSEWLQDAGREGRRS